MFNGQVLISDMSNLEIKHRFELENEEFLAFTVDYLEQKLATSSKNGLIRVWDLETKECKHSFKLHGTVGIDLDFHQSGRFLAVGTSDSCVKIYDLKEGLATHDFPNHRGLVTKVRFHPDFKKLRVISASDQGEIKVLDLLKSQELATMKAHKGQITDFIFTNDKRTLITSGRD